mgnify:CR=1 FL=1
MEKAPSSYKIKFLSGELAGRTFAILNSGTVIGRNRDADIRPGGTDIAPEHVTLMPQSDSGVLLHVFENASAQVNGEEVPGGEDRRLLPGADVRIGRELTFVLEDEDSPPPVPAAVSGGDDTEEPTEELTGDATEEKRPAEGDSTRYASAAELDDLRKFNRSQKRRKQFVIWAGILVFVLILGGSYVLSELRLENPVTWPGEVSGNYNDGEVRTEIAPGGKCLVYFPKMSATVVKSEGNNCEIMTALGKNFDVPFHIVFTVNTVPDGFRTTRRKSFDDWRKRVSEQQRFAFLEEPKQDFYRPTEGGFPYYRLAYSRQDKNFRWQGYASYMRYHDKELVLLREVPVGHFWRSDRVLQSFGAFVVSPAMVDRYWEIPEKRMEGDSTRLLQRVSQELRKNIAVAVWDDLDAMLRTLLCRAYESRDEVLTATVLPLWLEFKEKQQVWYSQCCLAYQTYQMVENTEGMNRIVGECLRRFPSPDDHRHMKIMKNIWAIEE